MINFEYSLNKQHDNSHYSAEFIRDYPACTFRGMQTFTVGDVDFSYDDVSILLFTRHIRFIWQWTGVGSKPYEMTFATGESPIRFTRMGDSIQIEKFVDDSYEVSMAKAPVIAVDLERAIKQYYKRPFKACEEAFPGLDVFGDSIDFIPYLRCTVIRSLGDGRSYDVRINEGGMLAKLVCIFNLDPGEELDAKFGTTSGCSALLTLTGEEFRKRNSGSTKP